MSGKKQTYYWDSCIYMAWLNREEPQWMLAVEEILNLNAEGKNRIVTSVITFTEVLDRIDKVREKAFLELFNSRHHVPWDVDVRIAEKARDLREHFRNQNEKVNLGTPDAIHLATAMFGDATQFLTSDYGGRNDSKGRKTLKLLSLGNFDLHGCKFEVCHPRFDQPRLL